MKVFITGIAGFIGFHLAMHLKKKGDDVIGCDSFVPYYDPKLKQKRAEFLKAHGISVYNLDICEQKELQQLVEKHKTTHLIHLAAQAGCRNCQDTLAQYHHSNLTGFLSVMEVCRQLACMKVIFASSSSVYGNNHKIPFSESDVTDTPTNLYAATKKSNELIAFSYHHLYHLSIVGLRFFTVYGPWGRPDMSYYLFTESILNDRPITLFGDGKMQRDFTYIDDIIQGITACLELKSGWEILNLGNHDPIPIHTLISLIEHKLGKKAIIQHLPAKREEVPVTYADITKAKQLIGYSPTTSIEQGMEQFLSWYTR